MKTIAELEQERTREQSNLMEQLADQDGEINRYRNLIATRSSELLIESDLVDQRQ